MLVLTRSTAQTARHTNPAAPDTVTTDKPAVMSGILVSIPEAAAEFTVKKSVFRAEVFYTDNATKAKEIVKRQKERYRDARHVVHAFVIGETGAILGCSDGYSWTAGTCRS